MLKICNEKSAAQLFGVVFLLVAVLGLIPNPLVSPTGIFAVNAAHNILHAVVGVLLLLAAARGLAKQALLVFGIVYVLIAILGYLMMKDMMFGLVMVNMPDHYLHLVLGIGLIAAGTSSKFCKAKK